MGAPRQAHSSDTSAELFPRLARRAVYRRTAVPRCATPVEGQWARRLAGRYAASSHVCVTQWRVSYPGPSPHQVADAPSCRPSLRHTGAARCRAVAAMGYLYLPWPSCWADGSAGGASVPLVSRRRRHRARPSSFVGLFSLSFPAPPPLPGARAAAASRSRGRGALPTDPPWPRGALPVWRVPPPPVRVRARRRSGGGLPVASSCRCARPGRRREAYMLLFLRTLC